MRVAARVGVQGERMNEEVSGESAGWELGAWVQALVLPQAPERPQGSKSRLWASWTQRHGRWEGQTNSPKVALQLDLQSVWGWKWG